MDSKVKFHYDAVIILSHSEWYKEMRSNRYNYATRFARNVPVYFVQIFNRHNTSFIAGVEGNITIINPIHGYTHETFELIISLLKKKNIEKVLIWIYSRYYGSILNDLTIPFIAVYHASEALLGSNFFVKKDQFTIDYLSKVRDTINLSSLVIAVSEGVADGIKGDPLITSPVYTITNGCDFEFWNGFESKEVRQEAILYQGGIHRKIDFDLISFIINDNPNFSFWFCGVVSIDNKLELAKWKSIIAKKNVKFFGNLHPDEVKLLSHKAKIGIIPFKQDDWLTARAFPLKAFEYIAAGMEVISTPIHSLEQFGDIINIAIDKFEFNKLVKEIMSGKLITAIENRLRISREQDYDKKFAQVEKIIADTPFQFNVKREYKKKILLLYDVHSCHINTIREHVNSFGVFSKNIVTFCNATRGTLINETFLRSFEAVVVHYSVRLSQSGYLSNDIYQKLKSYNGLKILFIQDEYDNLKLTYKYMRDINFNFLFTCVPEEYHEYVYPKKLFPNLKLVNNLTGYISYTLKNFTHIPIKERCVDVFYRGRQLPYIYGSLGREKYEIGSKFQYQLNQLGISLNLDLEANDSERIYGSSWYRSLGRSKTMLGTESGSNVFDFYGDLTHKIETEIAAGRNYEEIFELFLASLESSVRMNQISPKLFEAISLKTVLVLYEGAYSGILVPGRHYVELKKDFSNFQEVVDILLDNQKLQNIADVVYNEVLEKPELTYQYFIKEVFDKVISENVFLYRPQTLINKGAFYRFEQTPNVLSIKTFKSYTKGFVYPSITSEEYEYGYKERKELISFVKTIKNSFRELLLKLVKMLPQPLLPILFGFYKRVTGKI